jgi:hypothetical protein
MHNRENKYLVIDINEEKKIDEPSLFIQQNLPGSITHRTLSHIAEQPKKVRFALSPQSQSLSLDALPTVDSLADEEIKHDKERKRQIRAAKKLGKKDYLSTHSARPSELCKEANKVKALQIEHAYRYYFWKGQHTRKPAEKKKIEPTSVTAPTL